LFWSKLSFISANNGAVNMNEYRENNSEQFIAQQEQEWDAEERRSRIWSTDAAAALGENKYKTPLALYLEKIGEVDPEPVTNESAKLGLQMQGAIAHAHAVDTGDRLKSLEGVELICSLYGVEVGAHFDYLNETKNCIHEVKFFNARRLDEFGAAGSDQIPDEIKIQVNHQMAVWNATRPDKVKGAEINVLFGNETRRVYYLAYDENFIKRQFQSLAKFCAAIKLKIAPEPINNDDIKAMFSKDDGGEIVADDTVEDLYNQLVWFKHEKSRNDDAVEKLSLQLKKVMGEASTIKMPSGETLITWKTNKDSIYFDEKQFKETMPDLYSKFVKTKRGNRVFLIK